MEERKVKITINNGDNTCSDLTGKAAIGFVFDTGRIKDGTGDAAFLVGRGDPQILLINAAIQLGELARKGLMDDDNDMAHVVAVIMATKLLEAADGKSDKYQTVSTSFKKEEIRNESDD